LVPRIFAEGVVSTSKDEINAAFSPDGSEFFFSRDTYQSNSAAGRDYTIMYMRQTTVGWTKPLVAPFSQDFMNADLSVSYDNEFLFFCSDRPIRGNLSREDNANIWFVERTQDGWSDPIYGGDVLNSPQDEWYPTVTQNGTVYFSSTRHSDTHGDIFKATFSQGSFADVERIGSPISTGFGESDVFIARDESFMIVSSSDRPEGLGSADLYVSFKGGDGRWTELTNMGSPINTETAEYTPMVSPDGEYLFFTSRRLGNDDIYWVSTAILNRFRELKKRGAREP
jgi:Tol biopolymer transport system component